MNRVSIALMLVWMMSSTAAAQETFYLGEHTDFTGNGCSGSDLNDITTLLNNAMVADSWSGFHFMEGNSWPQDYMESTFGSGGIDNSFGDARGLTAYAGHGWVTGGGISFGTPHSSFCDVDIENSMRLGQLGGDTSAYMMFFTSCTMTVGGAWPANFDIVAYNNEMKQQFGFENSPVIQSGAGQDTFNCTSTRGNADCWNDVTEHQYEFWFGLNTPIVGSFSSTSAGATSTEANCKLRAGVCTSGAAATSWSFYSWVSKNSGVGPCS